MAGCAVWGTRNVLWSTLKRTLEWMIQWLHMPQKGPPCTIFQTDRTPLWSGTCMRGGCVCCSGSTAHFFKGRPWRSFYFLCRRCQSSAAVWFTLFWALGLRGRMGVTAVHWDTHTHTGPLWGRRRGTWPVRHLLGRWEHTWGPCVCYYAVCARGMWYLGDKLDIFLVFLHISWRSGALTWCEGFRQSLITNKMSIFESTLSRLMLLSYLKSDIVPRYSNVKQAYCNHSFYILGLRSHYGWSRLGYMKYPHILFQPPLAWTYLARTMQNFVCGMCSTPAWFHPIKAAVEFSHF